LCGRWLFLTVLPPAGADKLVVTDANQVVVSSSGDALLRALAPDDGVAAFVLASIKVESGGSACAREVAPRRGFRWICHITSHLSHLRSHDQRASTSHLWPPPGGVVELAQRAQFGTTTWR
jgi:hypothetical protein